MAERIDIIISGQNSGAAQMFRDTESQINSLGTSAQRTAARFDVLSMAQQKTRGSAQELAHSFRAEERAAQQAAGGVGLLNQKLVTLNTAKAHVAGLTGEVDKLANKLLLAGGAATALELAAAARYTAGALVEGAGRGADVAGLRSIMGGDEAAAAGQFETIRQIAKKPGVNVEGGLFLARGLQAAERDASEAARAVDTLGNAIAVVGKGSAEFDRASIALVQMASKADLSAQEFRQLAEAGIPMARILKEAFGTSDEDAIAKMDITGAEGFSRILAALEKMPEAEDTAKNTIDNLGIAWKEARIAFGEGLLAGDTQGALQDVVTNLDELRDRMRALGKTLQPLLERGLQVVEWLVDGSSKTAEAARWTLALIPPLTLLAGAYGALTVAMTQYAAMRAILRAQDATDLVGGLAGAPQAAKAVTGATAAAQAAQAVAAAKQLSLFEMAGDAAAMRYATPAQMSLPGMANLPQAAAYKPYSTFKYTNLDAALAIATAKDGSEATGALAKATRGAATAAEFLSSGLGILTVSVGALAVAVALSKNAIHSWNDETARQDEAANRHLSALAGDGLISGANLKAATVNPLTNDEVDWVNRNESPFLRWWYGSPQERRAMKDALARQDEVEEARGVGAVGVAQAQAVKEQEANLELIEARVREAENLHRPEADVVKLLKEQRHTQEEIWKDRKRLIELRGASGVPGMEKEAVEEARKLENEMRIARSEWQRADEQRRFAAMEREIKSGESLVALEQTREQHLEATAASEDAIVEKRKQIREIQEALWDKEVEVAKLKEASEPGITERTTLEVERERLQTQIADLNRDRARAKQLAGNELAVRQAQLGATQSGIGMARMMRRPEQEIEAAREREAALLEDIWRRREAAAAKQAKEERDLNILARERVSLEQERAEFAFRRIMEERREALAQAEAGAMRSGGALGLAQAQLDAGRGRGAGGAELARLQHEERQRQEAHWQRQLEVAKRAAELEENPAKAAASLEAARLRIAAERIQMESRLLQEQRDFQRELIGGRQARASSQADYLKDWLDQAKRLSPAERGASGIDDSMIAAGEAGLKLRRQQARQAAADAARADISRMRPELRPDAAAKAAADLAREQLGYLREQNELVRQRREAQQSYAQSALALVDQQLDKAYEEHRAAAEINALWEQRRRIQHQLNTGAIAAAQAEDRVIGSTLNMAAELNRIEQERREQAERRIEAEQRYRHEITEQRQMAVERAEVNGIGAGPGAADLLSVKAQLLDLTEQEVAAYEAGKQAAEEAYDAARMAEAAGLQQQGKKLEVAQMQAEVARDQRDRAKEITDEASAWAEVATERARLLGMSEQQIDLLRQQEEVAKRAQAEQLAATGDLIGAAQAYNDVLAMQNQRLDDNAATSVRWAEAYAERLELLGAIPAVQQAAQAEVERRKFAQAETLARHDLLGAQEMVNDILRERQRGRDQGAASSAPTGTGYQGRGGGSPERVVIGGDLALVENILNTARFFGGGGSPFGRMLNAIGQPRTGDITRDVRRAVEDRDRALVRSIADAIRGR